MSIIQGTSKAAGGAGYEIDQSIRFDKTTSSHLSKTYGSAGNRRTWTFSTWFKRGKIDGTRQSLFAATGTAYLQVGPDAASREMITILNEGSGTDLNWYTTQVFRDASAWYHLVWQFDSTQADANNRTKLYINGSQVTDFTKAATPAQNFEGAINNAVEHKIGELHIANYYFDGYQAEINFIDGTALDPTSFGEYNDDGVWIPKAYDGSYGSNGFYITGEDSADLGADYSGNSNDFTSSGLTTTDQMLDTPTLNFPTFNPLNVDAYTLSDGNLNTGAAGDAGAVSTFAIDVTDSNGFYFEVASSTAATYPDIGLQDADALALAGTTTISDYNPGRYTYQGNTGNFNDQGSTSSYGATYTTNTIGVLVQSGNLYFSKDGVIQNSGTAAKTGLTGMMYARVSYSAGSGTHANFTANFGQSAFTHDPGSTYKAWNTANLPTPSIKDGSAHFQPTLYTGNNGTQAIVNNGNSDLAPDLVWIKSRTTARNHILTDAVRGVTKSVSSNTTSAEATDADNLTAFGSDGFTVGDDTSYSPDVNASGVNYVAWQWAANGAGSSNTDGSLASTVSANTAAGFSIVTATPGTSGTDTIGHGLGVAPKMIIGKNVNLADNWHVYHDAISPANEIRLNTTGAATTTTWQSASTSSVFQIINGAWTNGGQVCLFYCFAEIPGYSSIGSYKGNGSATNGPFVYTGFKPKWIMYKSSSNAGTRWGILDTDRSASGGGNSVGDQLFAELANTEANADHEIDFLSNGFKVRDASGSVNGNGYTITYMAFAENPFGGDGVAPATAR